MEFKKGDRVKIVDDGRLRPFAALIAEKLGLTKWKNGYGAWKDEEDEGVCQNKTGVIIDIDSGGGAAGVEIDNEDTQVLISVQGLELIQDQKPVQSSEKDSSDPFPTLKEFLGV
jgi:hypothetical protein